MKNNPLPAGFIEHLKAESPGLFDTLEETLTGTRPEVSVRGNQAKGYSVTGEPVPWCPSGVYLPERPVFTLDPALHQGLYYVQDASSMFISMVARQIAAESGAPLRWLDACAAPGGKSTCVAENLLQGSLVVANELVPARAAVLRENIVKWGNPSMIVTRADARRYAALRHTFDVVTADVPCSGEGMMRKDAEALAQWSEELVKRCAAMQREIVGGLWEAVAPGGFFIYSTCTFNRTENEDMVRFILSELGGELVEVNGIDSAWGIVRTDFGYRFIPGRTRGEGLFMALIGKPGKLLHKSTRKPVKAAPHSAREWIDSPAAIMSITDTDGRINAFPSAHTDLLSRISSTRGIDIIHHGTVVAQMKGRDLVPTHSLALSTLLNRSAFTEHELDREEALAYLRAESITLPRDTPRGHVLLTHAGHPLGFAKHLGTRTNSLYPREWRIRMSL